MITEDIILQKYSQLKNFGVRDAFNVHHIRDILIVELTEEFWMVVTCDSDGGIGPKESDSFNTSAYDLGRFGARVPIMEMISSGATPVLIADVLAVEMDPTGKEIIRGVKDEAALAGIDFNNAITGSTEDNIKTVQTGMGVVIVGFVEKKDFRPGKSKQGDIVVCVGTPKSAPEHRVEYSDPMIADPAVVQKLTKLEYIHDILPVGSKGIRHEFAEMAKSAKLKEHYSSYSGISITKSGGPSTCCLVSLEEKNLNKLKKIIDRPVQKIGELRK